MSGRTGGESIMSQRKRATPDGEPIFSDTRKLSTSGDSIVVNVTSRACDIIGWEKGEAGRGTEVEVEVYPDKYVIRPLDDEHEA